MCNLEKELIMEKNGLNTFGFEDNKLSWPYFAGICLVLETSLLSSIIQQIPV